MGESKLHTKLIVDKTLFSGCFRIGLPFPRQLSVKQYVKISAWKQLLTVEKSWQKSRTNSRSTFIQKKKSSNDAERFYDIFRSLFTMNMGTVVTTLTREFFRFLLKWYSKMSCCHVVSKGHKLYDSNNFFPLIDVQVINNLLFTSYVRMSVSFISCGKMSYFRGFREGRYLFRNGIFLNVLHVSSFFLGNNKTSVWQLDTARSCQHCQISPVLGR